MFNPLDNSIFKKLQKDNIFNQIFKRFFDSLIVVFVITIIFLILNMYFIEGSILIFKIYLLYSQIVNFVIIISLFLTFFRIYRCLNLLDLVYKSINKK
jgi:hypothetical protein